MKRFKKLRADENGAAMIEMAFALPIFLMLIWMVFQLGLIFRANAGIQNALGEGARFATLFPTPADADITAKMLATVDGIGPGTFTPTLTANNTEKYRDLQVTYTQSTNLIMIPGPTVKITKKKRVWVAS
jgi:Flp pilus assembly protein TadG